MELLQADLTQGLFITDREYRIGFWNQWLEQHTKHKAAEMVGRNLFEIYPDLVARNIARYYLEAVNGKVVMISQPLHGYLLPIAFKGLASANLPRAYNHMQQSARIVPFVQNREIIGTITLIEDVTQRVISESQLAHNEKKLRALFDSTLDGILISDDKRRYVEANDAACKLFGTTRAELIGSSVDRYVPEELRPQLEEQWQSFIKRGVQEGEFLVRRPDGALRTLEYRARARFLPGLHLSVLRDVTERKMAEESRTRQLLLERVMLAQEQEKRFIARELHDETGQMLTSILMGLKVLEMSDDAKKMREQATALEAIITQTLDNLSRLARGLHPTVLEDHGLAVALERLAHDYQITNSINVMIHADRLKRRRLPPAVEIAFYRIIQEALTNAVKHAAARTVTIQFDRSSAQASFKVVDDGCGFDVEKAMRLSSDNNRLGLYGMRERVILLGGVFTIESRPGAGTTISVSVPLHKRV